MKKRTSYIICMMKQWNILRKNLHQTSQFPLLCLKSLFSWVQLKVSCSWWWKMIWGTKGPWRVSIILGLDNTCGGWLVLMEENNKLSWSNCKSIKQLKILSLQCVCMTHPPECRLVIVLLLQYNTLHWPTPLNFVVTQHWTGYLKYWSLQDTCPGGGSNQQHQQQSHEGQASLFWFIHCLQTFVSKIFYSTVTFSLMCNWEQTWMEVKIWTITAIIIMSGVWIEIQIRRCNPRVENN